MLPQVYPCNLHIDIPLGNFITYPCADPDPQINIRAKTQTHELIPALKPGPVVQVSVYHGYRYGLRSQYPRVTRALAYSGSGGLTDDFLHVSNCICMYCNAVRVYPHVQRACVASGLDLVVCRLSLRFDR